MSDDDVFDARGRVAGLSPAELVAVIDAAEESLADAPLAALSEDGLLDLLESREQARRKGVGVDAAVFVEISDRGACRRAGYSTVHQLLTQGLRIGEGESRRRRVVAASIGRFTAMTGQRLDPKFPVTAAAVADGAIGETHVWVIEEVMDKIPTSVDPEARVKAEAMLADAARRLNPAGVTMVGNRILAHLDPDGTLADDKDRQRQAKFRLSAQDRQLMSAVQARLTPQLRAEFEVVFVQWAAPGMNNPNDPDSPHGAADQPGLDPAVLAAAAERDDRLLGRRQHDALLALLAWANAQFSFAKPDSLRNQIVVTVTDEDLARHAGIAWTTTGTRIPVSDLVTIAADAVPYLAVFSKATGQPSTSAAPTASPPGRNAWRCSPATGAVPRRAVPARSPSARCTTCPTGSTAAPPTPITSAGPAAHTTGGTANNPEPGNRSSSPTAPTKAASDGGPPAAPGRGSSTHCSTPTNSAPAQTSQPKTAPHHRP
ncbi:DUF222 domain-containing protein [Gordonia sp. (in: high G+C Gram-positive bacteria)]|uniref:DUF222 domain-containing protein n=1 Tax=Gordonia sp. (in: high G+C Gram-positive bacteria) TaxID=84139 RepID=UPI003528C592